MKLLTSLLLAEGRSPRSVELFFLAESNSSFLLLTGFFTFFLISFFSLSFFLLAHSFLVAQGAAFLFYKVCYYMTLQRICSLGTSHSICRQLSHLALGIGQHNRCGSGRADQPLNFHSWSAHPRCGPGVHLLVQCHPKRNPGGAATSLCWEAKRSKWEICFKSCPTKTLM